jgi:hypothetical protein
MTSTFIRRIGAKTQHILGNSYVPANLRTERLKTASQKHCCLNQPFWCIIIFVKSLKLWFSHELQAVSQLVSVFIRSSFIYSVQSVNYALFSARY